MQAKPETRRRFSWSFSLSQYGSQKGLLKGRTKKKHNVGCGGRTGEEVKKRSLSLGCPCDGRPVGTTDVHDVMPEEGWRDAGRSERHEGGQHPCATFLLAQKRVGERLVRSREWMEFLNPASHGVHNKYLT